MSDIVPCGQIDGHGYQCKESAKCRQCQEIERLRGEIADWESHWNSHETELKTEIERLQKKLWEVAPMCCHDCGEHVRIDEDGCCAYCGGRTYQGIEKRIGEES